MNKYQELRSKISEIEDGEGIARFYSGAIFGSTSWYTSGLEKPKSIENSSPKVDPSPVRQTERPAAEASPLKKEVLNSLAKKVEESGGVQSKFGNIVKDVRAPISASSLKLTADKGLYQKSIESSYSDFRFCDFEGISTLIVGESTIPELNSENKHIKTKHDSSELLGKMIIPMKLEEGDFVRTSLLGASVEENLQNLLCEISLLKPKVVISLGAVSTNLLYGMKEKLSKIHGNEIERVIEDKDDSSRFTLFPLFHPDLLEINPSMKRTAWTDLQKVMKFLGKL